MFSYPVRRHISVQPKEFSLHLHRMVLQSVLHLLRLISIAASGAGGSSVTMTSKNLLIFLIHVWLDHSTLEFANETISISDIRGGFVKPCTLRLLSLVVNCCSPAVLCTYFILHLLGCLTYQIHRTSVPHIFLSLLP